jgi:hypothetical protein
LEWESLLPLLCQLGRERAGREQSAELERREEPPAPLREQARPAPGEQAPLLKAGARPRCRPLEEPTAPRREQARPVDGENLRRYLVYRCR